VNPFGTEIVEMSSARVNANTSIIFLKKKLLDKYPQKKSKIAAGIHTFVLTRA